MERPGKSEAGVRQMREAGVGQEEAEEWGGGAGLGGGGRGWGLANEKQEFGMCQTGLGGKVDINHQPG